ncbi:hypothetical protein OF820_10540 [Oceanotoga sp. DSM 15011]|nr:hypothetical protein [Oceanotoga sp. DSM 15011]UYO99505.1 hypothetical protein OF820_10540 [Oceanotoga sp. DSM 15011]
MKKVIVILTLLFVLLVQVNVFASLNLDKDSTTSSMPINKEKLI